MKSPTLFRHVLAVAVTAALTTGSAVAQDAKLSFMIYADGNEAETYGTLIEKFEAENEGVEIELNVVGFDIIREGLESQLEAGTGPDMALIVNLGGLNPYYLDLAPYVDVADWEADYGSVLDWYRGAAGGDGIYGFHAGMTVTGPFVNMTLFEEAGVDVPAEGATWDDWADATREVMDATGSYAGMVMDRSGHRVAGPAMSYGAAYFDGEGNPVIDEGFKNFMQKMIDWHEEGLMPADVWPAASGAKYQNGNEMFASGDVPFHMAGSWATASVAENVGDSFEWAVVPVPCGPAGCGIMPGGNGVVAFKDTEHPEMAAKFVDFLSQDENAEFIYGSNFAIPAHAKLQAEGVDYAAYGASEAISASLNTFAAAAGKAAEQTPQAFQLQGYPSNFVVFNATVQYVSAAMNGELTLDEAIEKINEDMAANIK
jgi:alpha-1,4-digalacturonate transport system substrate-binding protein